MNSKSREKCQFHSWYPVTDATPSGIARSMFMELLVFVLAVLSNTRTRYPSRNSTDRNHIILILMIWRVRGANATLLSSISHQSCCVIPTVLVLPDESEMANYPPGYKIK